MSKETDSVIIGRLKSILAFIGGAVVIVSPVIYLAQISFGSDISHDALQTFFIGLQTAAAFLATGGIFAAYAQVREAKKQLRDSRRWNRMSFALQFLPSIEELQEWEKSLENSIQLITRNAPLTAEEVARINGSPEIWIPLKNFLNVLERYAQAINVGLADEEVAQGAYRTKLLCHYRELEPYIADSRQKYNSLTVFCEMQKVYERWAKAGHGVPVYGEG